MVLGFIVLTAILTYFLGTIILLRGGASHVSFKSLKLQFLQLLLRVPLFAFQDGFFLNIICYGWNVCVISSITYKFLKPGCRFQTSYDKAYDDFPCYWSLVLVALIFPLVITFAVKNSAMFQICYFLTFGKENANWLCIHNFLWATSYCLMPLMFLPQLRICKKLAAENRRLSNNVQSFLLCMMVYEGCLIFINFYYGWMSFLTSITGSLTILPLGAHFCGWNILPNCSFCPTLQTRSEGNDIRGTGVIAATTPGILKKKSNKEAEMFSTEDHFDLPSISIKDVPNTPASSSVPTNSNVPTPETTHNVDDSGTYDTNWMR